MTEQEISRLYKKAKPQRQSKEYFKYQHEKHKDKRNAERLERYHRQKVDKSKLNLGLL